MNINYSANSADKRYFPRWKAEHRVIFQRGFKGEPQEAKTLDLSCSGMCFKTDEKITIGQRIKATLYVALDKPIELTGNVVWTNSFSDYKEVGVQFYNTTDESQDIILEYAFEINREKMVNAWFKDWKN